MQTYYTVEFFAMLMLTALVVSWVVVLSRRLSKHLQRAVAAWSQLDLLLRHRQHELAFLLEMGESLQLDMRDRLLFDQLQQAQGRVNDARLRGDVTDLSEQEARLRKSLIAFLLQTDDIPSCAANVRYSYTKERLSYLEQEINSAADYYNQRANQSNHYQQGFPHRWVAHWLEFEALTPFVYTIPSTHSIVAEELFEYGRAETASVD